MGTLPYNFIWKPIREAFDGEEGGVGGGKIRVLVQFLVFQTGALNFIEGFTRGGNGVGVVVSHLRGDSRARVARLRHCGSLGQGQG